MKKFWWIVQNTRGTNNHGSRRDGYIGSSYGPFSSRDDAVAELKRRVDGDKSHGSDWYVLEAVIAAKIPVPDIEVVELK